MKFKQCIISFLLGVAVTLALGAATVFQFTLSPDVLYVDGVRVNKALYKYEGSNYMPLRAIAEALGATVEYDKGIINITTIKPGTVQDVARQADNCALVKCYNGSKLTATASGVLIGKNYILTNKHVLNNANKWYVYADKIYVCKEYETFSTLADMAILITDRPHNSSIKIGDSDKLKVGDEVVVISSPRGTKNVVQSGRIAKKEVRGNIITLVTDIPTSPGSSGGGLFNMQGELVGLIYGGYDGENLSAAIPINAIKEYLE